MTDDQQHDDIQAIEAQMDTELDETSQLQAQLEESERERDQFKAMALRYKADLDNYKKRAAQEMEERQRSNLRTASPEARHCGGRLQQGGQSPARRLGRSELVRRHPARSSQHGGCPSQRGTVSDRGGDRPAF